MSSHREAPAISKDPVADNTDTYAWRTPGNTVTIITNYLPVEAPAGGPNFYEFDDDVAYNVNIDNDGDGKPNITYQFRFKTVITNPNTFLYNTGPITSLDSAKWNRRQSYKVTKIEYRRGRSPLTTVLGGGLASPPCNIGPRSTPNYASLASAAVATLGSVKVFAGQRADAFFVDLGAVFDLGTLRPFQNLHLIPTAADNGRDSLAQANVHTIAIQVPIADLTRDGNVPSDPSSPNAVIGVWGAAYRQKAKIRQRDRGWRGAGPWMQVSRLGNPLFNEVIVPMARKDEWNSVGPTTTRGSPSTWHGPSWRRCCRSCTRACSPTWRR
jgi:Domain of unknown function (DUF4331)